MRFQQYITEAEVREVNIKLFFSKFLSPLSKRVGSQFYRFGGPNHIEKYTKADGKSGKGYSFILKDGRLIRFNFDSNAEMSGLSSIDIWKNLKNPLKPTKSILIPSGFNYLQALDKIASEIKVVKPSINEAKKDDKAKINHDLSTKLGLDPTNANTLRKRLGSIEEIVGVPGLADKASTWLMTIKNNGAAVGPISNKVSVDQLYKRLDMLLKVICTNKDSKSLMVTGSAGTGKTTIVEKELTKLLGPENGKWYKQSGYSSPRGLFNILYKHRDKEVIVFDDCDSVFKDQKGIAVLKAALNSNPKGKPRKISWSSANTLTDGVIYLDEMDDFAGKRNPTTYDRSASKASAPDIQRPNLDRNLGTEKPESKSGKRETISEFEFYTRIIFISNLHESRIDDAVKSRAFTIDITLEKNEIVQRIESILPQINPDTPMSIKKEVFEYFKSIQSEKAFSIRMFTNLLMLAESLPNGEWKELTDYA